MSDIEQLVIILGSIIALSIISMIIYFFTTLKKPIVSVEVEENVTWTLNLHTKPGKKYWVCLRYDIRYKGSEDIFGLVVDYQCELSGKVQIQERAGIGDLLHAESDRKIMTISGSSFSSTFNKCREKGVIVLIKLKPTNRKETLTAKGKLLLSDNASLVKAKVFFS